MDLIIEEESGTDTPRTAHQHNGYYGGDLSSVAFKQPHLPTLLLLTRVTRRPPRTVRSRAA
jgi:hypothetical protein